MQAPILGAAGHDAAARVTPGQAATLAAVIGHAADCGLPLPTDDFMFLDRGASFVLPVRTVDEVAQWCKAFQDDDQHAAVLSDTAGALTMWWCGGLFLDVPVIVRAERLAERQPRVAEVVNVPLVDGETLIGGVA